jgi:hypothetical protein
MHIALTCYTQYLVQMQHIKIAQACTSPWFTLACVRACALIYVTHRSLMLETSASYEGQHEDASGDVRAAARNTGDSARNAAHSAGNSARHAGRDARHAGRDAHDAAHSAGHDVRSSGNSYNGYSYNDLDDGSNDCEQDLWARCAAQSRPSERARLATRTSSALILVVSTSLFSCFVLPLRYYLLACFVCT